MAARERSALTDLAAEVGPDAPTLCEGWAVRDLLAHLAERESGSPATFGVVVPAVRAHLERRRVRRSRGDFTALVEDVRQGPPRFSLFGLPGMDKVLNSTEFFIHHEDLRRAQPGWEPRALSSGIQDALWRMLKVAGRLAVVRVGVGVVAERPDTGERLTLKKRTPSVVVRGEPAEVLMFVHGRRDHARVELVGSEEALARLASAHLGV